MGNSTSAMGWMRKSNFQQTDENDTDTTAKLTAARLLARVIQDSKSCLYAQWFPGKDNDVSDSLSRDQHLSIADHTHLLRSSIPNQLPPNFRISQVPQVINSWLCLLLGKLPVNKARQVKPKMSEIAAGADGSSSSPASNLRTTLSS